MRSARILVLASLALIQLDAGTLGFVDADLLAQSQQFPQCLECTFIVTLESPPHVSDPRETTAILIAMGVLAIVGFTGMKFRVRTRR